MRWFEKEPFWGKIQEFVEDVMIKMDIVYN